MTRKALTPPPPARFSPEPQFSLPPPSWGARGTPLQPAADVGAGEDGPAAGAAEEEAPATADPPPEPEEAAAENVGEQGAGTAAVGRLLLGLGGPGVGLGNPAHAPAWPPYAKPQGWGWFGGQGCPRAMVRRRPCQRRTWMGRRHRCAAAGRSWEVGWEVGSWEVEQTNNQTSLPHGIFLLFLGWAKLHSTPITTFATFLAICLATAVVWLLRPAKKKNVWAIVGCGTNKDHQKTHDHFENSHASSLIPFPLIIILPSTAYSANPKNRPSRSENNGGI